MGNARNGIPLGSLVEVFPALHSSFLFPPFSFQQEARVYVWLSLVLSCFVHFLGWLNDCAKWHSAGLSLGSVPSLAFFLSISSTFFSARSTCLCLVVVEFVMLSIFWAGWVVVSAFFFDSRGSEHVKDPENNFKLGGKLTESHSTGISPGSVPSPAFFVSISLSFFSASDMCVCLVLIEFVMLSIFWAGDMYVCLVLIEFVMLSIFWAGWVVVSAGFRVSRGSEHVEYTPKII